MMWVCGQCECGGIAPDLGVCPQCGAPKDGAHEPQSAGAVPDVKAKGAKTGSGAASAAGAPDAPGGAP